MYSLSAVLSKLSFLRSPFIADLSCHIIAEIEEKLHARVRELKWFFVIICQRGLFNFSTHFRLGSS